MDIAVAKRLRWYAHLSRMELGATRPEINTKEKVRKTKK